MGSIGDRATIVPPRVRICRHGMTSSLLQVLRVAVSLCVATLVEPAATFGLTYAPGIAPLQVSIASLWAAGPMTDRSLQANSTSRWLVSPSGFAASTAGAALGWPATANHLAYPFISRVSLVRLLGGWTNDTTTPSQWADVVYRAVNGSLAWRWEALWDRMDPAISAAGLDPVVVLDNVPFALATGGGELSVYGQVLGPANLTEYGAFVETLVGGVAARYGADVASLWLWRVGTEPNTRPGHWNASNDAWVGMYIAAATALRRVLPTARVGPGNFCPCPGTLASEIRPILQGIIAAGAPVSFLAASFYGSYSRHSHEGYEPSDAGGIAATLVALRADYPGVLDNVPLFFMEYGTLDNEAHVVSGEPGAFGAAWRVATTSVSAALGVSAVYTWPYFEWSFGKAADVAFASGMLLQAVAATAGSMPNSTSPSAALVASAGTEFFCRSETTLPDGSCVAPRLSNATGAPQVSGLAMIASGPGSNALPPLRAGQLGPAPEGTFLAIVAAFSADRASSAGPLNTSVTFDCPDSWEAGTCTGPAPPPCLALVLSEATLLHDRVLSEAVANGTNSTPAGLVNGLDDMLTPEGLANVRGSAPRWLARMAASAAPSSSAAAGVALMCTARGSGEDGATASSSCTLTASLPIPSVWVAWCGPGL